jgi:hypothetical protein
MFGFVVSGPLVGSEDSVAEGGAIVYISIYLCLGLLMD